MWNAKVGKSIYKTMWPFVLLLVVMISVLAIFSVNSNKEAKSVVEEFLYGTTTQCASRVLWQLSSVPDMAVPSANYLEKSEDCTEKDIQDISSVLQYTTGAENVLICAEDGEGYWGTGEEYVASNNGDAEQIFSSVSQHSFRIEPEKGKFYTVSCVPFTRNGKAWNIVLYFDMDNLKSIAKPLVADGDSFFIVMTQKGQILTSSKSNSKFVQQENLFDFLAADESTEVKKFYQRIMSRNNAFTPAVIGGEQRVLVASPVENGEIYAVVGYDKKYVDKRIALVRKSDRAVLWELIVSISFLTILLLINVIRSKLHNSENKRNLEEKADTDLLTGMNNKLATERKIKEYIADHPTEQCMMVLLDLDNFKKINDTMGHAFGDEVLRSLGNRISSVFRVSDIMGRIGGDEFMVFLKGMNSNQDILKQSSKITDFFRDFRAGEYVKYSSTASIGVAIYPHDGKNFEELYKAADKALYKAKKNGKNQLAFCDDAFFEEENK